MNDLIANADKAYEERDFEKALILYNQEISARPENLLAQDRAARCLWVLKRHVEAIDKSKKILGADPSYVSAHLIMAEAYYDLKEILKAREAMQQAYSIDPNHIEVLTAYGSFLLLDKKTDEALILLEKSIKIDTTNYGAYNNLAVIYSKKHDRERVLFCAKEMYKLRPHKKNKFRLILARMDYYRITNLLLMSLIILSLIAINIQNWLLLTGALGSLLFLILFPLFLRNHSH